MITSKLASQPTEQATQPQHEDNTLPTIIVAIPSPTARPQVKPVYGICGHIARSSKHTCGSWSCLQMWGW